MFFLPWEAIQDFSFQVTSRKSKSLWTLGKDALVDVTNALLDFGLLRLFFQETVSWMKTEKADTSSQLSLNFHCPFHETLWLRRCILPCRNVFLLPEHPWKKALKCSWVSLYDPPFWRLSPKASRENAARWHTLAQTGTVSLQYEGETFSSLFHACGFTWLRKLITTVLLSFVSIG